MNNEMINNDSAIINQSTVAPSIYKSNQLRCQGG